MTIAVQFSGGKDSTVVLHLIAGAQTDEPIVAYFCNTGAMLPHLVEFVHETCDKLKIELKVVQPAFTAEAYIAATGFPTDIMPVESSTEFLAEVKEKGPHNLQPYTKCCGNLIWLPMMNRMMEDNIRLCYRGTKETDRRVPAAGATFQYAGISFFNPIWEWTDKQVFEFCKVQDIKLAAHYPELNDSLDCWLCTAHLPYGGKEKIAFLKKNYPEHYEKLRVRLDAVRETLDFHSARIYGALRTGDNNG